MESKVASSQISPTQAPVLSGPRPPRCLFCDSLSHVKSNCVELEDALKKGIVALNVKSHIVHPET